MQVLTELAPYTAPELYDRFPAVDGELVQRSPACLGASATQCGNGSETGWMTAGDRRLVSNECFRHGYSSRCGCERHSSQAQALAGDVLVSRHGRPAAALVPVDEYEALEETAEILSDPDALAALEAGLAELERGETVSLEDLRRELDEHRPRR